MWILAVVCTLVSVGSLFLRGPKQKELPDFRVAGAAEPTFRLIHADSKGSEEIWQLILGKAHCELIRNDGTVASRFPRSWAEIAIRLPGFVAGEHLAVATEKWSPPGAEPDATIGEIVGAATKLTRWGTVDIPCYWFVAPEPVVREIKSYQRQTRLEHGSAVATPIRIKARRDLLTGTVGLLFGVPILVIGIDQLIDSTRQRRPNAVPPDRNRAVAGAGRRHLFPGALAARPGHRIAASSRAASPQQRRRVELVSRANGVEKCDQTLVITSDAFCPPKPKLLEMAVSTGISRDVLGT